VFSELADTCHFPRLSMFNNTCQKIQLRFSVFIIFPISVHSDTAFLSSWCILLRLNTIKSCFWPILVHQMSVTSITIN